MQTAQRMQALPAHFFASLGKTFGSIAELLLVLSGVFEAALDALRRRVTELFENLFGPRELFSQRFFRRVRGSDLHRLESECGIQVEAIAGSGIEKGQPGL